jgi:hypothetical protein
VEEDIKNATNIIAFRESEDDEDDEDDEGTTRSTST